MAKPTRASVKEMLRLLAREGFSVRRIRGSHHFLNRGDTDTVVPVHGNRPLKTGTLRKIRRDIDMTPGELADRLKG